MAMLSASKLRPLVGAAAGVGGRRAAGSTTAASIVHGSTINIARRGVSVLGAQSQKHLLSEFVGVRGPVAEEVRIAGKPVLKGMQIARFRGREVEYGMISFVMHTAFCNVYVLVLQQQLLLRQPHSVLCVVCTSIITVLQDSQLLWTFLPFALAYVCGRNSLVRRPRAAWNPAAS